MTTRTLQTLHVRTFGCQMNAYDSARMEGLLRERLGLLPEEDPDLADVIVLNTCHIREKAEEKLFSELGRLHKSRRGRPVVMAVGGCVGQAQGSAIFRRAPFVDIVFGPQNYHRLPEMLTRILAGESRVLDDASVAEDKFESAPPVVAHQGVGQVTVQEGCDAFCTYCVVPFTRGREWSRPVAEVVAETERLVAHGAVEIHLLGQNVNAYNGPDEQGTPFDLGLLLRRVALVDGVKRIRFVTSHPKQMDPSLVEALAEVPEVCPYLHLPIQSGSDRILEAMGRGHTVADYLHWVETVRRARPGVALASDFIVGFPGEDEAAFAETLALVERVGFDHAYSFKFSARPGTVAASLPDQVPEPVKKERLERLQTRLNAIQWEKNRQRAGRIEEVLVEGMAPLGKGHLSGRTPCNRMVHFPGDAEWIGRTVRVAILEGLPNSLRGRLEKEPP
ncbi:MAG: tRNA (N6-isopentenyl adenosine(37)-C2)-methylthiotransferase MiaB [Magnetococcales bacterium]|nr:tRNA (N6-isopentenyl adenosine(37)-C2)-methylthiotransferase MiaB [Magnetococcales bacterium]